MTGRSSKHFTTVGRAFTLLELLVVVVLLGLVATGVALSVRGVTEPARLRGATVQLEQLLRAGRQRALRRHEPAWLQLRPGTRCYRLTTAAKTDTRAVWQTLGGVTIARAAVCGRDTPRSQPGIFTLRIGPTGATLPWAAELHAGSARRVVWTDGVAGGWHHREGVGLDDRPWEAVAGGLRP